MKQSKVAPGPFGARKPSEPSRMVMYGPVTVDDVLQSLVGRGPRLESDLGPKLDVAEAARPVRTAKTNAAPRTALDASNFTDDPIPVKETKDSWKAMDKAEHQVVREMGVDRCVREFCAVETFSDFPRRFRESAKKNGLVVDLSQAYRGTALTPGGFAVTCLQRYQEWRWLPDEKAREFSRPFYSEARAFDEVLSWFRKVTGKPDSIVGEKKRRQALNEAKSVYTDCLLLLDSWVKYWNANRV